MNTMSQKEVELFATTRNIVAGVCRFMQEHTSNQNIITARYDLKRVWHELNSEKGTYPTTTDEQSRLFALMSESTYDIFMSGFVAGLESLYNDDDDEKIEKAIAAAAGRYIRSCQVKKTSAIIPPNFMQSLSNYALHTEHIDKDIYKSICEICKNDAKRLFVLERKADGMNFADMQDEYAAAGYTGSVKDVWRKVTREARKYNLMRYNSYYNTSHMYVIVKK